MTWLRRWTDDPATGRDAVVVFPPAGSGCLRWKPAATAWPPDAPELVGVQLPGREDRIRDPAPRRLGDVVAAVAAEVVALPHRRVYFIGISLGALTAWETARLIAQTTATPVTGLVVAAARSPDHWRHFPSADPPREHLASLIDPSVRDAGLLDYTTAVLRADLLLTQGYTPSAEPLRRTAMVSVSGAADTIATTDQMHGWRVYADDFRGHHVFASDHHEFATAVVLGQLAERLPSSALECAHADRNPS